MRTIKNFFLFSLMAAFALTSCDDDPDPVTPPVVSDNIIKSGLITADETWTANNIYELAGRVVVDSSVTLTIDAGTIIKGREGQQSLASALIIARGGKIMANGTAAAPIVFTSILDNITVGQTAGTNLSSTNRGLWGGIIINGRAQISADSDVQQIEGIPADDTYGRYGSTTPDNNDNSGVFTYVSIRHAGTTFGGGNDLNGLTLGGVGAGTTINNVEVVGNLDDGIEPFGGNVNLTNVLVWDQGDDAFDIDQAYSGTFDNIVYIAGPESDHGMEIDGPEGTYRAGFTIRNGSMKGAFGTSLNREYADFRDGAQGTVENVYWFNFEESSDVELDDDDSSDNYKAGDIVFTNWEINTSHLSTGNLTIADIFADKSTAGDAFNTLTDANVKIVTTATQGANISAFSWTYANQQGALTGF